MGIHATSIDSGDLPTLALAGHIYKILATGDTTGGAYVLWHARIPGEDAGPPLHKHSREDESFYILAGEFAFQIGTREIRATPGCYVHAPRHIEHTFRILSEEEGELLIWASPAGLEHFLVEAGQAVAPGSPLPPPPTEEELGRIAKVAPKYGIEIWR